MSNNGSTPLISIIVAVYNGEKYLRRCIDSLLQQTIEKAIEIIIIDDGSEDGTPELCDQIAFENKNVIVFHQENSGLSRSRNVGIEMSRGEYIGFVDADDWVAPNMYEELLKLAQKYNAGVCSGRYAIVSDVNQRIEEGNKTIEVLEREDKIRRYLEVGISNRSNLYSACTKLYRSSLFENIRFPVGQRFEDMETNYKLIEATDVFVVYNCNLYYYYMDSVGITRNKCKIGDLDLIKATQGIYQATKGTTNERLGKTVYARSYFSILLKYVAYGIDPSIDECAYIKQLRRGYNQFFGLLLCSRIPLRRKALMPFLRISPKAMRWAVSCVKKS